MLLLSKVIKSSKLRGRVGVRGRPCSLIGRSDLGLSDRSVLSNQITGNRVKSERPCERPCERLCERPNSDSLAHDLSTFVM